MGENSKFISSFLCMNISCFRSQKYLAILINLISPASLKKKNAWGKERKKGTGREEGRKKGSKQARERERLRRKDLKR